MGSICCKDDMHLTNRNVKPTIVRERRVSVHTQPNVPTSTMILPPHLVKTDQSYSSLYLSCITGKDGSNNISNFAEDKENGRSIKSHISPITPYYNSNGYMTYPICPDDLTVLKTIESSNNREIRENHVASHRKENGVAYTFGDVSTEGNHRKIESNDLSLDNSEEDGFFEAHSFFDNDKENPGMIGLFERGSVLSQKTGSFRGLSDHVQSNQKVSNHVVWANEIEETATGVETANTEGYDGYEKVFEAERAVDGLKVYMKNDVEEEDGKWSCVKAEWKMRCDAESFIRYVNSFEGVSETIKDSQIVEQCETFEDVEDNVFAVYYISSERGAENKDCLFVRSYRQLEEDRWRDIFKSIECKKHPEYEGKKRLYIKCGGHMVSKDGEGCKVRLYMEAMLGKEGEQSIPVSWVVDEIKYYVGKCCDNLN